MEFAMSFAKWYLVVGLVLNMLAGISLILQGKNPGWKLIVLFFFVTLFITPAALLIFGLWWLIDPPTGDPHDLVYSRLSYYEGKTGKKIEHELRANGESLGPYLVNSVLDDLEEQGLVRAEQQKDGLWYHFRAGGKAPKKRSRPEVFLGRLIPMPIHNVS